MSKAFTISLLCMIAIMSYAQEQRIFQCNLYNNEHKVYFVLNLYEKNITIPGQEIFGEVDGYLGSKQCTQVWAVTSSTIQKNNVAEITLINNYGSEDLIATLTLNSDGTYTYQHKEGSTLKFPVNGKWHKIPKKILLLKKDQ